MKKAICIILALLLIAALVGCGASSGASGNAGNSFHIEGKWKNVGDTTFGNVMQGGIVSFDGTHCNYISPQDTYVFYESDGVYYLDASSLLGSAISFTVSVIDNDNIRIYDGTHYVELKRVG